MATLTSPPPAAADRDLIRSEIAAAIGPVLARLDGQARDVEELCAPWWEKITMALDQLSLTQAVSGREAVARLSQVEAKLTGAVDALRRDHLGITERMCNEMERMHAEYLAQDAALVARVSRIETLTAGQLFRLLWLRLRGWALARLGRDGR